MDDLEIAIRENSRSVERSFWIRKLTTLDIDTDLIAQINAESLALSEVIDELEQLKQKIETKHRSKTNG